MYAALPRSEYYGGSAPPAPSAGIAPIPDSPSRMEEPRGTYADGSHVHCCSVDGLGTRLYPCGIANGYAVDIHRGLPTQTDQARSEVPRPVMKERRRTATQPTSTGLELVNPQEA